MERLTRRDSQGRAYFDNNGVLIRGANGTFHQKKDMITHYIHDRFVSLDKAIDRLAAYEDAGLEPEEVTAIKNAVMGQGIAKITEFEGIPVRRLRELAKAEKDGRLVVLPCRLHQPLYTIKNGEVHRNYGCQWHFTDKECQTFGTLSMYGEFVRLDDFGKAVFLTREEAEAALQKREVDNEAN